MRRISLACSSMSLAWPSTPPHGWCRRMRACGKAKRLPLAPAASSTAAAEAAWPKQNVETSALMNFSVS